MHPSPGTVKAPSRKAPLKLKSSFKDFSRTFFLISLQWTCWSLPLKFSNIFFELLKKQNYSGWLVVEAEQDPAKANPFEYAKIGYKYLIETLKSANLEIENY